MRLQRLRQAASQTASGLIDQEDAFAMEGLGGRQKPKPAQFSIRTCRKIESSRIGAIDDIEVVIPRQNQDPLRKPRIDRQGVEQF
jgi:hypothetical protein